MKSKKIEINGIEITIIEKKIKKLYIRISPKDAAVNVSVPLHISYEQAKNFIEKNMNWIAERQAEVLKRIKKRIRYESGDVILFFGNSFTLQIVSDEKNSVEEAGDVIFLKTPYIDNYEHKRTVMHNWYRQELKLKASKAFLHWEKTTGLKPSEWKIRDMKTRWGSCSISGRRISLNLQLAALPYNCLEYVVLHELVHLKEANHGNKFEAILYQYMPEWKSIHDKMSKINACLI